MNQNRIVGEIGIFRHPVLSKLDWDRGRARRWWLPRPHRPFMVRKLSPEGFYKIRDPKNFHAAMRADVELLLSKRAYLSLTTVIMCCLDALAAGSGRATRGKFERFVTKHFHDLCTALESVCPGRKSSGILYEEFRNGFAHLRVPKAKFAIAEDHELGGDWADLVEANAVGQFVAINIDRLAGEFLTVLGQL